MGRHHVTIINSQISLYKFISDTTVVPNILQGWTKFTPPAELNDPSELIPNVIGAQVEESLNRLREKGYTQEDLINLRCQENLFKRLAPKYQAVNVPKTPQEATNLLHLPIYDNLRFLQDRLNQMANEVSSKVGLFCSSLRFDSLPMWAHYAGNAKGLVVEYNGMNEVFKGDDTNLLSLPIKVLYERNTLSITFYTQSHMCLFFSKFSDWSYEKEVRVVLPLDICERKDIDTESVYLYKIPQKNISRLILGWNMPLETKKVIRDYVETINPSVEVVETRFVKGEIELGRSFK